VIVRSIIVLLSGCPMYNTQRQQGVIRHKITKKNSKFASIKSEQKCDCHVFDNPLARTSSKKFNSWRILKAARHHLNKCLLEKYLLISDVCINIVKEYVAGMICLEIDESYRLCANNIVVREDQLYLKKDNNKDSNEHNGRHNYQHYDQYDDDQLYYQYEHVIPPVCVFSFIIDDIEPDDIELDDNYVQLLEPDTPMKKKSEKYRFERRTLFRQGLSWTKSVPKFLKEKSLLSFNDFGSVISFNKSECGCPVSTPMIKLTEPNTFYYNQDLMFIAQINVHAIDHVIKPQLLVLPSVLINIVVEYIGSMCVYDVSSDELLCTNDEYISDFIHRHEGQFIILAGLPEKHDDSKLELASILERRKYKRDYSVVICDDCHEPYYPYKSSHLRKKGMCLPINKLKFNKTQLKYIGQVERIKPRCKRVCKHNMENLTMIRRDTSIYWHLKDMHDHFVKCILMHELDVLISNACVNIVVEYIGEMGIIEQEKNSTEWYHLSSLDSVISYSDIKHRCGKVTYLAGSPSKDFVSLQDMKYEYLPIVADIDNIIEIYCPRCREYYNSPTHDNHHGLGKCPTMDFCSNCGQKYHLLSENDLHGENVCDSNDMYNLRSIIYYLRAIYMVKMYVNRIRCITYET
jgi:hypothetical protein